MEYFNKLSWCELVFHTKRVLTGDGGEYEPLACADILYFILKMQNLWSIKYEILPKYVAHVFLLSSFIINVWFVVMSDTEQKEAFNKSTESYIMCWLWRVIQFNSIQFILPSNKKTYRGNKKQYTDYHTITSINIDKHRINLQTWINIAKKHKGNCLGW